MPEPGNPQALNRYTYVRNNPLKYTDPSGYYSEEEIMRSFGVRSWDEVLAYFREGGALEGKWGWLEVLRRAHSYDWVTGWVYDEPRWTAGRGRDWEFGRICIGPNGEITIGGISQIEFAARWARYSLDSAVHGEYHFFTDAETMYWHPRLTRDTRPLRERPEDISEMGVDAISIFLDIAATVGLFASVPEASVLAEALQVFIDAEQGIEGVTNILNRRESAGFDSYDVLEAVGWIPWLGSLPDAIDAISRMTGYRVVWTP